MDKRDVIKDLFSSKIWLWIATPIFVAFLVGQGALYSRSLTLREVRGVDVQYTTALLKASLSKDSEQSEVAQINRIFNSFAEKQTPETHLGTALWIGDTQQAVNHEMLKGQSVEDIKRLIHTGDVRYSLEDITPQHSEHPIKVAYFRPELAHNMGIFRFVDLSLFQLADKHSKEITGLKFIEHLWKLWIATAVITFLSIFVTRYAFCHHRLKLREKLEKLRADYDSVEDKKFDQERLIDEIKSELKEEEINHLELQEKHAKQLQLVKNKAKQQRKSDYELEKYKKENQPLAAIKQELEDKSREIDRLKKVEKERQDAHYEIELEQRNKLNQINDYALRQSTSDSKKLLNAELKTFFVGAFPQFNFKPSSFDVIKKFESSSQYSNNLELLIKYLSRLHNDRDKLQSKKLHGSTDAKEIKLTGTGHGHYPLRIYFCETSDKVFVMIGDKSNQNEDIRYLRKNFRSRR